MATDATDNRVKMTLEEILEFVRAHNEPCVDAGDVAEEFDVTREAAVYRLDQLEDAGEVQQKVVGSSAKIWYPVG